MRDVNGRRAVRTTWVVAGAVMATLAWAGCSASGDESTVEEQQVVVGVLLDEPDGEPVSGVELELLARTSQRSGAQAPLKSTPVDSTPLDTATTAADGSFELAALDSDLSPHAGASGLVGLEIRRADASGVGVPTSVRLTKAQDTGTTTVVPVIGLVVTEGGVDSSQ